MMKAKLRDDIIIARLSWKGKKIGHRLGEVKQFKVNGVTELLVARRQGGGVAETAQTDNLAAVDAAGGRRESAKCLKKGKFKKN
nr:hypothetical protein BaRGS_014632 [Batillaria attramentaria]